MKRISAVVFAVLLIVSSVATFAPVVVATGASSSGPPPGMVAADAANIHINGQTASDLKNTEEFRVYASQNANSLTVSYDVDFAANDNANACNASAVGQNKHCEVSGLSIDLTDNQAHEGREIAIKKTVVDESTGGNPGLVRVQHESGDQYLNPVEATNDYYVFEIKEFSTNTVTFEGDVSITGTPATDGTDYTYTLNSTDSINDYSINVTGVTSSETDSDTGSISAGDSANVNIAGTKAPTDASLELTGYNATHWKNSIGSASTTFASSNTPTTTTEVYIKVDDYGNNVGYNGDVYLDTGSNSYKIGEIHEDKNGGAYTRTYNTSINVQSGDSATVRLTNKHENDTLIDAKLVGTEPKNVQATVNGQTFTYGDFANGQTKTKTVSLDRSTSSVSVSADNAAQFDYNLTYTEHQQTVDPSVTVNGNIADHFGTLQDGETVELTADSSWVTSGTNTVHIEVGDGTETSDTPPLQVGLNYSHSAEDEQSVTYTAEKWSERYSVSKTYSSAREDTTLTIPFSGNVIDIRYVEMRVNDGSWESVDASNYNLTNTELTAQLGDVQAGDTVDVRAAGSRVVVSNGSITVTEPSVAGDSLDSEIRLDSWGEEAYIGLSGTPDGERVHATYNESWTEPAVHTEIAASGTNRLYLPNAGSNSTTQVTPTPLSASVDSNEVEIEVLKTGKPFRFEATPGQWGGDAVDYTYHATVSGEEYVLYSVTNDVQLDSATAQSPVTFSDDDSTEVLEIFANTDKTVEDSDDSGGYEVPIGPVRPDSGGIPDTAIMLGVAVVSIVGLYFLQRRVFNEGSGRILGVLPRSPLFLTGGGLVAFVTVDYASQNAITRAVGSGLEQVMPVLGLIGGALAAYYAYKRFIKGRDQTIVVRGRKK